MIYALIVAALSLAGAALPLYRRPSHDQLQLYLSAAAGALLGAALFHLLPESSEHIQTGFGLPAVMGVVIVFLLQRYLAPHSHEPPKLAESGAEAGTSAHDQLEHVHCEHGHEHRHGHGHDSGHHGMVSTGSLVGILALSIHSFFDGVAIGAVSGEDAAGYSTLAVFLSVLIHKPLDGLSVSILLLNTGAQSRKLWFVQLVYALLVPLGSLAFVATSGSISNQSAFVGYALAFSAGTFLAIALTDLLPEIQFHAHDRHKLSGAVALGLFIMWLTSFVGHSSGHEHETGNLRLNSEDHSTHGH